MTRPASLRDLCKPCLRLACAEYPPGPAADSMRARLEQPGALELGTCDCCVKRAPTLVASAAEVATARRVVHGDAA